MSPYQVLWGTYMPDVAYCNRSASVRSDAAAYLVYKGYVHLGGIDIRGQGYFAG